MFGRHNKSLPNINIIIPEPQLNKLQTILTLDKCVNKLVVSMNECLYDLWQKNQKEVNLNEQYFYGFSLPPKSLHNVYSQLHEVTFA